MMRKLDLLLIVLLLASSLGLVRTAYESRRVFADLDRARGEQRQLDAELKRLDAERQAQATHARVQRVASEQLRMVGITPAITVYVDDSVAAVPTLAPAEGSR
jgi:cell division protein FtsL